jgi:hypothetical protein
MKTFEVHFTSHDIIEAESFDDAREKFKEKHSIPDAPTVFYDCETSERKDIIGFCEISELPIFDGEDYKYDNEGVMWLTCKE